MHISAISQFLHGLRGLYMIYKALVIEFIIFSFFKDLLGGIFALI